MKKIIGILCLTILGGCTWNVKDETAPAPTIVEVKPFHPAPPRPLMLSKVEWQVLVPSTKEEMLRDNAYSYMCLDWSHYLVLGQDMQSILAKFDEYEGLVCYYRKDLKEARCEKFKLVEEK